MNAVALVLIYVGMLAFDAAVLGGTAYLVVKHGWSAWWMALAVLMAMGSNPRTVVVALKCGGA
jgi:hypothetical protein